MVKGILTQNNQLKAFLMMLFKKLFRLGFLILRLINTDIQEVARKTQNSTAKHGGKYISVSKSVGL